MSCIRTLSLGIFALAALPGAVLFAQDLTGTWQGTFQIPSINRELRAVIKISKDDNVLKAIFYSID